MGRSKPISHSDVRDCGEGKKYPSETGENQNVEQERLPLAIMEGRMLVNPL